jgi:hypothetical protein
MASFFMKTLPIALATAAAITPMAPVSAQEAGWVPVYDHYYYNDSSYSGEVGHNRDTCNAYGVGQTAVEGSWTSYVRNEIYAYCDPYGEIHPY